MERKITSRLGIASISWNLRNEGFYWISVYPSMVAFESALRVNSDTWFKAVRDLVIHQAVSKWIFLPRI